MFASAARSGTPGGSWLRTTSTYASNAGLEVSGGRALRGSDTSAYTRTFAAMSA